MLLLLCCLVALTWGQVTETPSAATKLDLQVVTQVPSDPSTREPLDPSMHATPEPSTYDPVSKETFDPSTKAPFDPSTKAPIDPISQATFEPSTEIPKDPSTKATDAPMTQAPQDQSTHLPNVQSTQIPDVQSTHMPNVQSTQGPQVHSTQVHHVQTTQVHHTQSTHAPHVQSTQVHHTQSTHVPQAHTTKTPHSNSTHAPLSHTTKAVHSNSTHAPLSHTTKAVHGHPTTAPHPTLSPDLKHRVALLEGIVDDLGRQVMLQQLYLEEMIRSDGNSGVKQVRNVAGGTRPMYGDTWTNGARVLSIHDHSNYDRTIGMGEFIGVLNGVEFRTRHNDYKLVSPSTKVKDYERTEEIPFPAVPPAVLSKATVAEQVREMREWFKAWRDQDHSHRDYRPYFKAAMCYLEGAWTLNTKTLSEPFDSDRHHLDAESWFQMQELIRYTSYTGSKSNLENFSYLPTAIYNVSQGVPQFAQWNYRILCHPIQEDLPTRYFHLIDDLAGRFARRNNLTVHETTRAARFRLHNEPHDRYAQYTLLDKLMAEIPGKDNYPGHMEDTTFGLEFFDVQSPGQFKKLSADRYHRWYNSQATGVRHVTIKHRAYSDETLFVALNTRPNIVPVEVEHCATVNGAQKCDTSEVRVSYAVPLEVIFMTPLLTWNPHNLTYRGAGNTPGAKVVEANGRNGGLSVEKAYNGTNSFNYYFTPAEFFEGNELNSDPADTVSGAVGVLDPHGEVKKVMASGSHIFLPRIPDVGMVRLRYPIAPAHQEGSAVWRELDALKEMVMNMHEYSKYFEHPPVFSVSGVTHGDESMRLRMAETTRTPPGPHAHDIFLTPEEVSDLIKHGRTVTVTSSTDQGHNHELEIHYDAVTKRFSIVHCDAMDACWDGHPNMLYNE